MAAEAAAGDIPQEQYFDMVINKYGNDAVRLAMETASLELETDEVTDIVHDEQEPITLTPQEPALEIVETDTAEQTVMNEGAPQTDIDDLEREVCQLTSSLKGLCIPCVAEPLRGVLKVMAMWYTGKEKDEVERNIKRLETCDGDMELVLRDVLKLKDADINLNTILGDLNKVIKLATDMALDDNPELIRKAEP
jgi:hypothetical protein